MNIYEIKNRETNAKKSKSRIKFIHSLLTALFSLFFFIVVVVFFITVHYNSIIIFHKQLEGKLSLLYAKILLKIHIILFYTLKVVQLIIFYVSQNKKKIKR